MKLNGISIVRIKSFLLKVIKNYMVYSVKKMERSGSLCVYTGWCVYHWAEKIHFSLLPHPIQGWPGTALSKQPALPSPSAPGLGIPDEWISVTRETPVTAWMASSNVTRGPCAQHGKHQQMGDSGMQVLSKTGSGVSSTCPPLPNLHLNVWFRDSKSDLPWQQCWSKQ